MKGILYLITAYNNMTKWNEMIYVILTIRTQYIEGGRDFNNEVKLEK
jgi:hypothetical protein